jgi:predicted transcriptional regulator
MTGMKSKTPVRASDVMIDRYLEIDGLNTVADAVAAMRRAGACVLIISKRDDDDEHGIVVLADISRKVLAMDRAMDRVNLYEIMTKPVIAVHPAMDVRYVARLFDQFGLNLAPVMDNGSVVGLVRYNELVLNGLMESANCG